MLYADTLPDKPSDLIELSLACLENCEADPDYKIVMFRWHWPTETVCQVCLAGALMACELQMPWGDSYHPGEVTQSLFYKFEAINYFRVGFVSKALSFLGLASDTVSNCSITPYETNPAAFKADMQTLADDLRRAGL